MKHKFRIIKKSNGKFKIQKKNWIFYETMVSSNEYENWQKCIDFIYSNFDKSKCEVKYDSRW